MEEEGITLVKVDSTEEANKPLAEEFGVKGFPTIKVSPFWDYVVDALLAKLAKADVFFAFRSLETMTGQSLLIMRVLEKPTALLVSHRMHLIRPPFQHCFAQPGDGTAGCPCQPQRLI